MSAHFAALAGLLFVSTVFAGSGSTSTSGTELVVYLGTAPNQKAEPLRHMKRELAALVEPLGYRLEWRDLKTDARTDAAQLIVAEIDGVCGAGLSAHDAGAAATWTNLGSSAVEAGRVLPFARVDCRSLERLLGAAVSSEPKARRDFLYGRAMARVLAHEFYHILGQTTDHSHKGIAKAAVRATELLSERFDFEESVLARMRREPTVVPPIVPPSTEESEFTGR